MRRQSGDKKVKKLQRKVDDLQQQLTKELIRRANAGERLDPDASQNIEDAQQLAALFHRQSRTARDSLAASTSHSDSAPAPKQPSFLSKIFCCCSSSSTALPGAGYGPIPADEADLNSPSGRRSPF